MSVQSISIPDLIDAFDDITSEDPPSIRARLWSELVAEETMLDDLPSCAEAESHSGLWSV